MLFVYNVTDIQTNRQILWHHIRGYVYFFFHLNLLPPYLLCSQGDKQVLGFQSWYFGTFGTFSYLGFLFWSDWGSNPHVGRSDLSGKNAKIILQKENSHINSIFVDAFKQRLFLIDAQHDTLFSCRYIFKVVQIFFKLRFLMWHG